MEIRKAQKVDYTTICSLINNELGYPSVIITDLVQTMKLMSQDPSYSTYVAVVDDKVVGFVGFMQNLTYDNGGKCIRITALAVSNDYQGKGVGSALLKYVESYANSRGISVLMLYSGMERTDAHLFYEKQGYTRSSYGFWKLINFLY